MAQPSRAIWNCIEKKPNETFFISGKLCGRSHGHRYTGEGLAAEVESKFAFDGNFRYKIVVLNCDWKCIFLRQTNFKDAVSAGITAAAACIRQVCNAAHPVSFLQFFIQLVAGAQAASFPHETLAVIDKGHAAAAWERELAERPTWPCEVCSCCTDSPAKDFYVFAKESCRVVSRSFPQVHSCSSWRNKDFVWRIEGLTSIEKAVPFFRVSLAAYTHTHTLLALTVVQTAVVVQLYSIKGGLAWTQYDRTLFVSKVAKLFKQASTGTLWQMAFPNRELKEDHTQRSTQPARNTKFFMA